MEAVDEYFWHTHTTAIACAMSCLMAWSIWELQLKSTTKRLTAFDSSYHVHTIRTLLICCVLLTVVPYFAMHLASDDSFPRSSCHVPAKQYEGNGSVFGQILQEVANTDGHVQSAQGAIQDDIHHLYHQLRDLIIAGFTISTLVLGLLIIYFTRKCNIQRLPKEETKQVLNTSKSAEN